MPWINDGHYVVRLKDGNKQPKGAVSLTRKVMMVQHVALYTIDNGENRLIGLFDIKDSESIPIKTNSEELKRAGYPSKSENKSYLLYSRY